MVLLVDDILGMITTHPFMFIMDQVKQHALREMHPLDIIKNLLKENRLEYELGEISKDEYEQNNKIFRQKLMTAQEVHEKYISSSVRIFEGGA